MTRLMHKTFAAALLLTLTGGTAGAQLPTVAERNLLPAAARDFALSGPEILKVHRRSKDLVVEDFNGDGLLDVSTVNNEKSIVQVYLQKKNVAADQPRFEVVDYTLDRIIRSVVATDFDGDGRTDLVMAPSTQKLVVMYQNSDGRLQSPREVEVPAERLALAQMDDKNGPDLVIFAEKMIRILPGKKRGLETEPSHVFATSGQPASDLMLIDFDGDGRRDIVFHDANKFEELVVRLQSPEGTFPSEFRVGSSVLRAVVPVASGGSGAQTVGAVLNSTRSLVQFRLSEAGAAEKGTEGLSFSNLHTISFPPEQRSKRTNAVVCDVDGDGRQDLLVYSPEIATLRLLRQTRSGALEAAPFPTLQGIESITALPSGKGPTPLLFFSPEERSLAIATWDAEKGSLPFPAILPVTGEPVGATAWKQGNDTIAAVVLKDKTTFTLSGMKLTADGRIGDSVTLMADGGIAVPSGSTVKGLEAIDANRDGKTDLIVFLDFKPSIILLQNGDGRFEALKATSGVLEGLLSGTRSGLVKNARLDPANDAASLLVVKEKFARATTIDGSQNVVVDQQFNGRDNGSRLVDATVGSFSAKGSRDVALLDRAAKVVTVYTRHKDGNFELEGNFAIDDGVYASTFALDLDGNGLEDLMLLAEDRLSILYAGRGKASLETVASSSTEVTEGGYGRPYAVNLVDPKAPSLIAIEMTDNLMEIYQPGLDAEKAPALLRYYRFAMFASDSTISRSPNLDAQPEPRELVVADLNDDGMSDLICLMHDNIVIYSQIQKAADKK